MATKSVGKIAVTAVSDGELKSSLDCILGVEKSELERLTGQAYETPIWLPVNTFLVDLNGKWTLIDAGSGPNMQPTLGRLPDNLRALGVAPEQISQIVLTHLHPDHSNGLIDAAGNAVFPNAELIVHEVEARFWLDRDEQPGDSERVRRNLKAQKLSTAPYRGRIRRVPDGEALPGLIAMMAGGHTPGHTCWQIESNGERLLIWGDIVHIAAVQVPRPDTGLVFDVDPVKACASRRRMFEHVAGEKLTVAGAHLGYPGFATIEKRGDGYAYTAV